jgi:leucine-rich repeat-containing G protein-coupled receptor 6
LKTFHNKNLQERIDPDNLPHIQNLVLSYAYHCCSFINARKADVGVRYIGVEWLFGE